MYSRIIKNSLINKGHKLGEEDIVALEEGIMIDNKNKIIWGASGTRGLGKAVGY